MKQPLRAVIFDFGNTLVGVDPKLHSKRTDYADVVAVPGAEQLARHLEARGILVPERGVAFIDRFLAIRERNRMLADASGNEIPATVSLRESLREFGRRELDAAEVEEALREFFAVEEAALQALPGAGATLRALEKRGIAMALLSNATDGPYIVRVIQRHGWSDTFQPLVVTSDIGVRKPRPDAFQAVLGKWSHRPEEIAMVGDSLKHDIQGAQALGLPAFHLTMIPNPTDPAFVGRVVPDGAASTHEEMLRLLLAWGAAD